MKGKEIDSLSVGTVLKSGLYTYVIENVLGQGSFGITYLASVQMLGSLGTIKSNQKVAIKEFFMRDQNGRDGSTVTYSTKREICDEYRSKFIREAVKLASLNHPNIIKVMDAFECNETSYYVMEYHADGSLNDFISKNGNPELSAETVLHLISVIAEALGHMHSSHMIHLDLKPDNILMQGSDDVVLIDFGLSKQYDENGEPESSTMIKGGTPGYMPLEQCSKIDSNGLPVTLDIYALGATMYKMLTGQRPPEAHEVLNDGLPTPPSAIDKNVWNLVCELMSPKKQDRPQNIAEVLKKLNALKTELSAEAGQTEKDEEDTIVVEPNTPDIDEEDSVQIPWVRRSLLFVFILAICGGVIYFYTTRNSKSKLDAVQNVEVVDSIAGNQSLDSNEEASPDLRTTPSNGSKETFAKADGSNEGQKQVTNVDRKSDKQVAEKAESSSQIYSDPDQQAEFPGGQKGLIKYLSSNLSYPAAALENDIQGKVYVRFVIEKDGSVSSPTVISSVSKDLDNEAIRLIRNMPRWRPGKNNGVAVKTYYTLPINFRLQ